MEHLYGGQVVRQCPWWVDLFCGPLIGISFSFLEILELSLTWPRWHLIHRRLYGLIPLMVLMEKSHARLLHGGEVTQGCWDASIYRNANVTDCLTSRLQWEEQGLGANGAAAPLALITESHKKENIIKLQTNARGSLCCLERCLTSGGTWQWLKKPLKGQMSQGVVSDKWGHGGLSGVLFINFVSDFVEPKMHKAAPFLSFIFQWKSDEWHAPFQQFG